MKPSMVESPELAGAMNTGTGRHGGMVMTLIQYFVVVQEKIRGINLKNSIQVTRTWTRFSK